MCIYIYTRRIKRNFMHYWISDIVKFRLDYVWYAWYLNVDQPNLAACVSRMLPCRSSRLYIAMLLVFYIAEIKAVANPNNGRTRLHCLIISGRINTRLLLTINLATPIIAIIIQYLWFIN